MPLPLPNLDDRRWADLVEEGRALIPLYSPRWSDHNVHDPGITLVELFAWIAEMDVYRVNRVSDRHRRKFMQLIGVAAKPPAPASVPIAFSLQDHVAYLRLPRTLEVEGRDAAGVRTSFRLTEPITVVPSSLEAILREDVDGIHDLSSRRQRGDPVQVFGTDPGVRSALYLGFNQALPSDQRSTLYFLTVPSKEDPAAPSSVLPAEHHSVRTAWEFLGLDRRWRRLDADRGEVQDETRCFTRDGHLRFAPPASMAAMRLGATRKPLHYLRCRIVAGQYDDVPAARAIVMNAVLGEQAVPIGDLDFPFPGAPRVETERIGVGSGEPNQPAAVSGAPLLERGFRLFTIEGNEWLEWTRRRDLDSSGPADAHATLDATTGVVRFGDGNRGRVVPDGARIVASGDTTRGAEGNVAAGTVDRVSPSRHNHWLWPGFAEEIGRLRSVTNPVPAAGGAAGESVPDTQARVFDELTRPRRAVTLEDYEALARLTPGVRLARVGARARMHPDLPCVKAPGVVTLIVLPYLPAARPMPSRALLRVVARHLDALRTIGSCVQVTAPSYVEISVRATVEPYRGVSPGALQALVSKALDRFFHPLSGGPDGWGWPFGRDVYRSEVMHVIDRTPGVDHVLSLELSVDGGPPRCGNVCIGALGLVAAGDHAIHVVQR